MALRQEIYSVKVAILNTEHQSIIEPILGLLETVASEINELKEEITALKNKLEFKELQERSDQCI